jgi:YVTN family beta-propeller protein
MSRTNRLRPLAGLLATGLAAPALADPSVPFPNYVAGPQGNGVWVLGNGQIITPAGTQVDLGDRVRAKAIALNPTAKSYTAAVLTEGVSATNSVAGTVEVLDTRSGDVLQLYVPSGGKNGAGGSYSGITYSADGKYLLFSQDGASSPPPHVSYVTLANVSSGGLLTDYAQINAPPNNTFIECFPNSPNGPYGRPCGTFYSPNTSYPGGVAFSKDGKSAYALLNQNNTLANIDLTKKPLTQGQQIRVGNAPHSILINSAGTLAYISNEGGRAATAGDFQIYSAGTPIVADQVNGSATTGTVSVVNLSSMQVVDTISTGGLHPTGMAMFGGTLLVANTYSDTISIIDTAINRVMRTINLGLPIAVPGEDEPAYGAAPCSIAVDASKGVAYVALYNANAIAVVDLSGGATQPVMGMIPVAYAPGSVVLDKANNQLIVANDKGIGTRLSFETDYDVSGYNSHQDNGTVSIVPLPNSATLASMTTQVYQNNHWDLTKNIDSAGGGSPFKQPVPIPAKIGDPSLIKHVFLIIRENRTYDQILGDVAAGNGEPSLAVFGGKYTPNAHALVKRFPLLDNFYTPSRQSADGHQWIMEAIAPYADDIQSPDWIRSYPGGNAGDALAYTKQGFLFQAAAAAGLSVKIYGEYVETDYCVKAGQPLAPCNTDPSSGPVNEPSWSEFYADSQQFEAAYAIDPTTAKLKYQNTIIATSTVPAVSNYLVKNFPQFDLNIPDQFRVDLWLQDFNNDVAAGTVPALSILWIMDDHTGGPPSAQAQQADNDLAVGRIIDYISHSNVWASSAILLEEDDSQDGVDHIDGHRSPGYVVSPYAVQSGPTDHTYYTQVNMTRTIEQILGLPPMNQFDLVASPITTVFVTGTSEANFAPFTHLPNEVPLDMGVMASNEPVNGLGKASKKAKLKMFAGKMTKPDEPVNGLEKAWRKMKLKMFAGKMTKPDAQDPDTLNHLIWYEATGFKRPYPGEKTVRPPTEFKKVAARTSSDID